MTVLLQDRKRALAIGNPIPKSTTSLGYTKYDALVSIIVNEETSTSGKNESQPNSFEVSKSKTDPRKDPGPAPGQLEEGGQPLCKGPVVNKDGHQKRSYPTFISGNMSPEKEVYIHLLKKNKGYFCLEIYRNAWLRSR